MQPAALASRCCMILQRCGKRPSIFFSIQKAPTTSDACVQKLSGEHYLFFSMQLNIRRLNWLSQGRDVQAPGRSPELLKDSSGLRGVEESTEGKHSISPQGVEDKPFSRKTRQKMNEEDCFAAGQQARGISQLTTPHRSEDWRIKLLRRGRR